MVGEMEIRLWLGAGPPARPGSRGGRAVTPHTWRSRLSPLTDCV